MPAGEDETGGHMVERGVRGSAADAGKLTSDIAISTSTIHSHRCVGTRTLSPRSPFCISPAIAWATVAVGIERGWVFMAFSLGLGGQLQ